jgi:hypothetical protein
MKRRQTAPITTFADTLAASEERAERARDTRRALSLRLLMWRQCRNPYLNALLKLEYVATLPLRLVLALIAAPFALHNRPIAAAVGFFALFGFWEIFNGLAKQPLVTLYQQKVMEYETEAVAKDKNSTGDVLNSNYRAVKWLVGLPFRARFEPHNAKSAIPRTAATDTSLHQQGDDASASKGIDGAVARLSQSLDHENRRAFDQTLRNLEKTGDHTTEEAFRDAARRSAAIDKEIDEERDQRAKAEIQEERKKAETAIKKGECINKPFREVLKDHLGLPCEQLYQPLDEAGLCHGEDDCRGYVTRLQGEANEENQLTQPNNQ